MCLQDNLLDQLDCVGFLILILITTTMCVVCPLVPAVDVSTQYTALLDCRKDSAVATLGWITCTTYNLTQIYIHQDCISTLIFIVCRCGFCDPVSGVVCNSPVRQEAGSTNQLCASCSHRLSAWVQWQGEALGDSAVEEVGRGKCVKGGVAVKRR